MWFELKEDEYLAISVIIIWILVIGLVLAVNKISELSQRWAIGRSTYKVISFVAIPLVFIVVVLWTSVLIISSVNSKATVEKKIISNEYAFQNENSTYVEYEQQYSSKGSLFIDCYNFYIVGKTAEGEKNSWDFYVIKTEFPSLQELVLRDAKKSTYRVFSIIYDFDRAVKIDDLCTNDVTVYMVRESDGKMEYLIYDDRTVMTVSSNWAITGNAMDVIYKDIMMQ